VPTHRGAIGHDFDVFERFTERARQVVVLAQEEMRTLKHDHIGTEHILLGLLREEEGLAARVLENLDITVERVRAQVVRIVGLGEEVASEQIPFTPSAKKALESALPEALALGHKYIGTEHILLGLLRTIGEGQDDDATTAILSALDADLDRIRVEVMALLSQSVGRTASLKKSRKASEAERTSTSVEPPLGLEAVPTHADRPATEDALGRAHLAEVLAERMRRVRGEDTERPAANWRESRRKLRADRRAARDAGSFMVHVHAPWGAGKSSFLNFLAADLRNSASLSTGGWPRMAIDYMVGRRRALNPGLSQWVVIEFNAWEHQRLAPPWWWLLTEIRRSCARELWRISRIRWAWFWARDLGWRLWNSRVTWITLLLSIGVVIVAKAFNWFGLEHGSLNALKASMASVSLLLASGTAIWGRVHGTSRWLAIGSAEGAAKFLKRAHDPLGVYRSRFRWLVHSTGHPIAVFIDDLDRCKPDYVVELLEGIQTLFGDDSVTYVVAADRTWLCESFASMYGDFREIIGDCGRPLGFLFLEKTFQVSMEIPPMSSDDRKSYWQTLISTTGKPSPGGTRHTGAGLTEAFAHVRTHTQVDQQINRLVQEGNDRDDVLRAAVRKLNAPSLQAQLEDLLREFAVFLENNPRSMKRLVNAYGIERDRLLREDRLPSTEERKRLVLFTILRLRWPLFAEYLLKHPEDVQLFSQGDPISHSYGELFSNQEVRALFDASQVAVRLNADALRRYAGLDTLQQSSVGA
jgi:Arc/MetJ-type ribon-helix-helix transcriptional regulator